FGFLHETAIIAYHGVLYASWYNCPKHELNGYTPICEKRSYDGGNTWTELRVVCEDPTGKILYCPPVYAIDEDRLYMLVNQMVAPDHIHSLDLYVLDPETDRFTLLWSRPIPFKLNTNAVRLPNGKWMLPGRIGQLDGFPNTPAVMLSDTGKIDSDWRLVKIAEDGSLPDGSALVHPEISVICARDTLYMFCRNDQRKVPIVYISKDYGETWSSACGHDIPYVSSKIYTGTLQDGQHYLIANIDLWNRSRLAVFFSKPEKPCFDRRLILFDGSLPDVPSATASHYPAAWEADGKLYVIATLNYESFVRRGAVLYRIDLSKID
ncbi:MAG: exo-alpha-sialidase, partial [Clostridia bacterium]|nr:exo-alpha-sialidase [Clostridia bacterium]